MMKAIDKQVQETMQDLDQAYSNAYWDQALLHIENKERRRRRIIGFWWVLAAVILISAGSLIWWTAIENQKEPIPSSEKQMAGIAHDDKSFMPENDGKVISNKMSEDKNDLYSIENSSSSGNKPDPVISNNRTKQNHRQNSKGPEDQIQKMIVYGNVNDGTSQATERIITDLVQKEEIVIKNSDEWGKLVDQVSLLPSLPISPFDTEFLWKFEKPEIRSDHDLQPVLWHLGILSELSVLTNVPGRGDEKAILGAQTGAGLRLKSGTGFFTGVSAGYAIRTGTFSNMLDHPTPEYVFEKKEEGFRMIPTTLSYAQSQVYAGWERGRWSGRAGLQGMYLVGATGELYTYSNEVSTEDPGVIISRVSKVSGGSISTPAFLKWVFELQAGLEFAISQRWKLTGQFAYTPKGLSYPLVENIYDPIAGKYETTAGASILKEQFLHIQLGIQYQW